MEKNIQDSDSKTAEYFNKLSNSKTPFLDEILASIKGQSERGLLSYQVDYYRVTDKTLSELRNMGFSVYKGGIDNSDYIIDWA